MPREPIDLNTQLHRAFAEYLERDTKQGGITKASIGAGIAYDRLYKWHRATTARLEVNDADRLARFLGCGKFEMEGGQA